MFMGGWLDDGQFDSTKKKMFILLSSYQNQYDHEDTGSLGCYTVPHEQLMPFQMIVLSLSLASEHPSWTTEP